MRKLASIQKILAVDPILDANAIDVATVLGWKVVVKKGEFKPGDLCVYCEVDSVLPKDRSEFEFLKHSNYRIRTVRLRGQISQGICFPLSVITRESRLCGIFDYIEGDEVTENLGIVKYEPPIETNMGGQIKGVFPGIVPKTDETRVQGFPGLLDEMKQSPCYITEKVDGCSASFIKFDGELDVCSRELSYKEDDKNLFWKVFKSSGAQKALEGLDDVAIQGEIAGPGIQKNKLKLKNHQLFVFNVFHVKECRYFGFKEFKAFCEEQKLPMVKVLAEGVDLSNDTIATLLEKAKGAYEGTTNPREGIVIRPMVECLSKILNDRLSVKVLNNDHLLKEE